MEKVVGYKKYPTKTIADKNEFSSHEPHLNNEAKSEKQITGRKEENLIHDGVKSKVTLLHKKKEVNDNKPSSPNTLGDKKAREPTSNITLPKTQSNLTNIGAVSPITKRKDEVKKVKIDSTKEGIPPKINGQIKKSETKLSQQKSSSQTFLEMDNEAKGEKQIKGKKEETAVHDRVKREVTVLHEKKEVNDNKPSSPNALGDKIARQPTSNITLSKTQANLTDIGTVSPITKGKSEEKKIEKTKKEGIPPTINGQLKKTESKRSEQQSSSKNVLEMDNEAKGEEKIKGKKEETAVHNRVKPEVTVLYEKKEVNDQKPSSPNTLGDKKAREPTSNITSPITQGNLTDIGSISSITKGKGEEKQMKTEIPRTEGIPLKINEQIKKTESKRSEQQSSSKNVLEKSDYSEPQSKTVDAKSTKTKEKQTEELTSLVRVPVTERPEKHHQVHKNKETKTNREYSTNKDILMKLVEMADTSDIGGVFHYSLSPNTTENRSAILQQKNMFAKAKHLERKVEYIQTSKLVDLSGRPGTESNENNEVKTLQNRLHYSHQSTPSHVNKIPPFKPNTTLVDLAMKSMPEIKK